MKTKKCRKRLKKLINRIIYGIAVLLILALQFGVNSLSNLLFFHIRNQFGGQQFIADNSQFFERQPPAKFRGVDTFCRIIENLAATDEAILCQEIVVPLTNRRAIVFFSIFGVNQNETK